MPSVKYDRDIKLELVEVESTLRQLLLDVAAHINPNSPSQLRFTGGWVRDKLLGVGSHDIDVAINDMTGYQFGLRMQEYLEISGNPEKYGLQGDAASANRSSNNDHRSKLLTGLHKIEANPEKSKHLETVTTRIFGLDIDLVNLRKEVYNEDSRNPQMEFGTPQEDAERRDATINAMFYNLQSQTVEDFTDRGFDDLEAQIIRTPLEPFQTFKDDPLRVLRLIRFASRLNYTIDSASEDCMKDPTIQDALRAKISRERVGVELDKMIRGPNPLMAMELIDRLGLYHTIFSDPTLESDFEPDAHAWKVAYGLVNSIVEQSGELQKVLIPDAEHAHVAWILSAFVPWVDAPPSQPTKKGGKGGPSMAVAAAREGIRAPNRICEIVNFSVRHFQEISTAKDDFLKAVRQPRQGATDEDPLGRDTLGMLLRKLGATWRSQLLYAMMVEQTQTSRSDNSIIDGYEKFVRYLEEKDLLGAVDLKHIIDGTALAKALEMRPGPWMRDALEVVMAWQLRNPSQTSPEGAIQAVRDNKGELTTCLIQHFLQLTIRPLFAKTQTAHVTARGHKSLNSVPQKYGSNSAEEDDEASRPWKKRKNDYALGLLTWVVRSLDFQLTAQYWPLLVPPLLALVDDVEPVYKAKGCQMITELLKTTPPVLLIRTSLADVFREAISLCLSYLPTLTPEEDSILLLSQAYPALFQLAEVENAAGATITTSINTPSKPSRSALDEYSKILHVHILPSIGHVVDSNPRIVITLLAQLTHVIEAKGVDIIADVIHLIPLFKSLLATPFAAAYPALLTAVASTTQTLLANAWPRASVWRADILEGICFCWIQIVEEESRWTNDPNSDDAGRMIRELSEAKQELRACVSMLVNAVEGLQRKSANTSECKSEEETHVDIRMELRQLAATDSRLADAFP